MSAHVLVLANMWPGRPGPVDGVFIEEQVTALRRAAPDWRFDVLVLETTRDRAEYVRGPARLRRALRAGVDLVHAHYGLMGALAVTQRRVPVVTTFHGSDVNIGWQRALSRVAALGSAASIFVADELGGRVHAGNAHTIPCGVELELFRPHERAAARRALGIDGVRPVIVFPGAPTNPAKDHALFEATLDALPGELREAVQPLVLTGLRRDQVPLLLSAADVLLVTSRREGSPMVVKEALACDLPVVSVRVGDVARVLEGVAGCRVVDTRAPSALAAVVSELLREPPVRSGARREAVKAKALDGYTAARRVLEVYRAVLGRSGRERPVSGGT